jgi:transposase InsO family protein
MNEKERREYAEFKYNIIGPVVTGFYEMKSREKFYLERSKMVWTFKSQVLTFKPSTLKSWYNICVRNPHREIEALMTKHRDTSKRIPRMVPSIQEWVIDYFKTSSKLTNFDLYREMLRRKIIFGTEFSVSTLGKFIRDNKLRKFSTITHDRLAFEMKYTNELWSGDTCFVTVPGFINPNSNNAQLAIIGFIDDASRRIVGCHIYFRDIAKNVISTLKSSVLKYGVPKAIYLDNGSSYNDRYLKRICPRVGMLHLNTQPYTPQSKAKIERFWSTLRTQWLSKLDSVTFSKIEEIQSNLDAYMNEYNNRVHSAIQMTPVTRYNRDLHLIKRLPMDEIDTCFMCTDIRKVRNDGTISLNGYLYQIESRYALRNIEFYFNFDDINRVYINIDGKLIEYKMLNKVENSKIFRHKSYQGGSNV